MLQVTSIVFHVIMFTLFDFVYFTSASEIGVAVKNPNNPLTE